MNVKDFNLKNNWFLLLIPLSFILFLVFLFAVFRGGTTAVKGFWTSVFAFAISISVYLYQKNDDKTLLKKIIIYGSSIFIFVIAVYSISFNQRLFMSPKIKTEPFHTWNVYHYYIGAKYFNEIGYFDIYEQTLAADWESKNVFKNVNTIRNMRTYKYQGVFKNTIRRNGRFTDERWDEFISDINFFTDILKHDIIWQNILLDRGYNPTPFWNTIGSFLANLLDIKVQWQQILFINLDNILLIAAFVIAVWAFGPLAASIMFFLLVVSQLNFVRMFDGFLKYDFFSIMLIALACFHKKKYITSAICWSFTIMVRVFPMIFIFSFFIIIAINWYKEKKIAKDMRKFIITGVVTCFLFFWLGCINSWGLNSWFDFVEKMKIHSHKHTYGQRRVGLKHFFTHKIGSDVYENSSMREITLELQKPYYYLSALVIVILFAVSIYKKRKLDAFIWGFPLFFILIVSSRYYWSIFVFLILLQDTKEYKPFSLMGTLVAFWLVTGTYLYEVIFGSSYGYEFFLYFNLQFYILFLILLGSDIYPDFMKAWNYLKSKLPLDRLNIS